MRDARTWCQAVVIVAALAGGLVPAIGGPPGHLPPPSDRDVVGGGTVVATLSACSVQAPAGTTMTVWRWTGTAWAQVPCSGTRSTPAPGPSPLANATTIYPNGLTLAASCPGSGGNARCGPPNVTAGAFPSSIRANDGDELRLSETCWKYSQSNNSTYCDARWSSRWYFMWDSVVPRWTAAQFVLTVRQSGDAEQSRVMVRDWSTGLWWNATLTLPPVKTTYSFNITSSQYSGDFGSVWTGLEDRTKNDGTRTAVAVDEIKLTVS